jgi:hypothetical protein
LDVQEALALLARPSIEPTSYNGVLSGIFLQTHKNNGRNNNAYEKKDISQVECFKCHNTGHYINECPQRKDEGNKPNPF